MLNQRDENIILGKNGKSSFTLSDVAALIIFITVSWFVSTFPDNTYKDYNNYFYNIKYIDYIFDYYKSLNLIDQFSNEPIWISILYALSQIFDPDLAIQFIIFSSCSIFLYSLYKKSYINIIIILLLLLSPIILKNYLVHLRQGLAISLFSLAIVLQRRLISYFIILVVPFIHSSFFFVYLIVGCAWMAYHSKVSYWAFSLITIVLGICVSMIIESVANLLGARQAYQYNFAETSSSGLAFLQWTAIILIFLIGTRVRNIYVFFAIGIASFYVGAYWFIDISSRILESGLILVILGSQYIQKQFSIYFIWFFLGCGALSWYLARNTPGFGFIDIGI